MAEPESMAAPDMAQKFLETTEKRLLDLTVEASQADWVYSTYITRDSEALSSQANARLLRAIAESAREATRWNGSRLSNEVRRKLDLIRLSQPLFAPNDPEAATELTRLVATLQGMYAKGRFQPQGRSEPLNLEALEKILAKSRSPPELAEVWEGWHRTARPMRPLFVRYVELGNQGARDGGFDDLGAMWRSKYDMPPAEFSREVDRLWHQVLPLYQQLHAYVRRKLFETYGEGIVPAKGPLPSHLLGNMWAQSWENVFPLVAPGGAEPEYDLTKTLQDRKTDAARMVRYAEAFFVSLGLDALPATFWERSMLHRPRDRDVVCHASAWDIDAVDDLRIKMCIDITADDFRVIHHELGHNYYQRAYNRLPFLFRDSAHDGFHEAIGDTIDLSVTPEYLRQIGLIESAPPAERDIAILLQRALEKIAFLPFGLLVDRWRWDVFAHRIPEHKYNESWNAFRREYQGVVPPVARSEEDFDPGAKFHVPANVPYMRYFLAHLLQFQFHRGLAQAAGWKGPLHRCSIYGNREAGDRLQRTLALGSSRPWPEALETLTGETRMDASALREYFAPLEEWLAEQNRGYPVGW